LRTNYLGLNLRFLALALMQVTLSFCASVFSSVKIIPHRVVEDKMSYTYKAQHCPTHSQYLVSAIVDILPVAKLVFWVGLITVCLNTGECLLNIIVLFY
jgi:hypothetical protein